MAHVLKSNFRTAGDATRFGGQLPTFYLDPANFTGTALPLSSGGTGATTEVAARTNLSLYSKSEVDTIISNATFGTVSTLTNGTSSVAVDSSQIQLKVQNGVIATVTSSDISITQNLSVTGNLTVLGNINGFQDVASKAHTAHSWGDHSAAGYFTAANVSFTNLSDVTISSPSNNQFVQYNSTSEKWENKTLDISNFGISSLSDVDTTNSSPSVGNVLKWSGTKWVPDVDKILIEKLDDLTDVNLNLAAPVANDFLVYNGSSWLPKNITEVPLQNLTVTTLTATNFNIDFGVVT